MRYYVIRSDDSDLTRRFNPTDSDYTDYLIKVFRDQYPTLVAAGA
jgi:hypothetical protein